jgi:Holliday junction DNA helicase RuvB
MVRRRFKLNADVAHDIGVRARGVARVAINYGESVARHGVEYFDIQGIDALGLTPLDRKVLSVLRSADRPLSLSTLAAMVCESPETLRGVVEPGLLALGLMEIGPKGRTAVANARMMSRGAGSNMRLTAV